MLSRTSSRSLPASANTLLNSLKQRQTEGTLSQEASVLVQQATNSPRLDSSIPKLATLFSSGPKPLDSLINAFQELRNTSQQTAPPISAESERFIQVLEAVKRPEGETSNSIAGLNKLQGLVMELVKYADKISLKTIAHRDIVDEIERNLMDIRKTLKPSTMKMEVKLTYFEKLDPSSPLGMVLKGLKEEIDKLQESLNPRQRLLSGLNFTYHDARG